MNLLTVKIYYDFTVGSQRGDMTRAISPSPGDASAHGSRGEEKQNESKCCAC